MSQFRHGLNKNANNPQSRRSVKATSWKERNKKKNRKKERKKAKGTSNCTRELWPLWGGRGCSRGVLCRVPRLLRLLVYSFFVFCFFCHTQHFLCCRFMSWDMEWWPFSHSLSFSDLFTCICSSFRCLGTFYGPAPAVSCSASGCWKGLINLESASWFT